MHAHTKAHDHAGHGHAHAVTDFGPAFALGIGLNLAYVAAEAVAGLASGSLALLADAGHNLSDVAGLLIAWAGLSLAKRPPSARFTWGLARSSILAALTNGLILVAACGAIVFESIRRFSDPQPVPGGLVMIVAACGIAVNGGTAWLFSRGSKTDVNVRGAYIHMLGDAGVSAAVVVGGLVIRQTGWHWVDPMLGLVVAAIIMRGTWGMLKESLALALDAVPAGIDATAVSDWLAGLQGVDTVHDLHIWPQGTSASVLTAHLIMPGGHPGDQALADMAHALFHRFGIGHATFQVETGDGACQQACPHA
ncbi:cation diffusion facilitator family transporter [Sandarakinorhabdus sp.]|uniref:cation diffusion facilitator family transporter n=1 Tax=Sandarakinorhabdus sp. TaxID=1916663 RepID=UPI00286E3ED2|nr:cation diffusion facilitator family transporter [Sandarakinorhabdus sp.]